MVSNDSTSLSSLMSRRGLLAGGVASLSLVACGTSAAAETTPDKAKSDLPPGLFLQLPPNINAYEVVVQMQSGRAEKAIVRLVKNNNSSSWNTYVPITTAQPGRILIYAPGYASFASSLTSEHLASKTPLVVPMRRLRTHQLHGTLRDSEGQPVAGKFLRLQYSLDEVMPFFGYYDGPVPMVPVTFAQTGRDGAFTLDIPSLEDDTFLGYSFRQERSETLEKHPAPAVRAPGILTALDYSAAAVSQKRRSLILEWERRPSSLTSEGYLDAETLPLQRISDVPLKLDWRYPGTVYGRVDPGFLSRNGFDSSLADMMAYQGDNPICLRFSLTQTNGGNSRSAMLEVRPDGGFSQCVPAGEYQLEAGFLKRNGYTLQKKVVVQKNIRIKEHDSISLKIT